MTDKTQNPAEVFLVEVFDGEDYSNVWCDTPAPGEGMREEDATRYVREDLVPASNEVLARRVVELTNERDALAAQVEQLRSGLNQAIELLVTSLIEPEQITDTEISELRDIEQATPAQCLAEVKAQAVIEFCDTLEAQQDVKPLHKGVIVTSLSQHRDEYIQQLLQPAKQSGTWLKDSNTHCNPVVTTLAVHLERQIAFSLKAFGPAKRTGGIIDHMKKELAEVAAAPDDLTEWIDLVMLALDGAWRHVDRTGMSFTQVAKLVQKTLTEKLAKNEARSWPDWRALSEDKAIEHNRCADELAAKEGA